MNAAILCLAISAMSLPSQREKLACRMMPHIIEESSLNEIRPTLLVSLIYIESGWKRKAKSASAGACGLTQIIPKWTGSVGTRVPRLRCDELFRPKTSITMGARLVRFWIQNYGVGNEQIGLCGYNSGYRCKGDRPFKKGMRYARAVLSTEKKLLSKIKELQLEQQRKDQD